MEENKLSVVIPIYNEQDCMFELYNQLVLELDKISDNYEIIFVNDGSTDNSEKTLNSLVERNSKVRLINFRKNFGQTAALSAGFNSCHGDLVVSLDSDLQNDPRDIGKMIDKLRNESLDVVCGWRAKRNDSISKKILSKLANSIRKIVTGNHLHDSGCTLRVYKKNALDNLELFGEMHRFIPDILVWQGFKVGEVVTNHRARQHGKTKYSLTRIIKGILDLFLLKFWMDYARRPIHLFGGFGILLLFLGFLLGVYLTIAKFFYSIPLSNRPLLFLVILLILSGFQLVIFGVLADIMIRSYYNKDNKPYYLIKNIKNDR
jgi:glycosyltransferase involved in cell wall biosynthesis